MKLAKLFIVLAAWGAMQQLSAQSVVINNDCRDITRVPTEYLHIARKQIRIAYGHTSHGSQIISGMQVLAQANPALFGFDASGTGDRLSLRDGVPSGDLGGAGDTSWAERTRDYLRGAGNDRNLVMWSWCGGCSGNTEAGIDAYLAAMTHLEQDFPGVTFVYMTGHLDGTGETGNLHRRNEQIRAYCIDNGKVLFDFADLESYDPDGNYFLDMAADDGCNYEKTNGQPGNWAEEWCSAHPGQCPNCSCAHSHALNCYEKGKAFWWMMARVAGWDGVTGQLIICYFPPIDFDISLHPNPTDGTATIEVDLPVSGEVEITLWNALGQMVATILPEQHLWANFYRYPLPSGLATGIYMVAVRMDGRYRTEHIIVQRR